MKGTRTSTVSLSWTAAAESGAQYHVYRSTNSPLTAASQFVRLTTALLSSTNYTDLSPPSGTNTTYMVRALVLTTTGSGTYTNVGQGAFIVR